MKIFYSILIIMSFSYIGLSQNSPVGLWQAVDDKDGEATSHIEVYEVEKKLHARIVKLLKEDPNLICEKCKGDKKGKPLVGMEIMWGMKLDGDTWKGGKIMDPENGKEYKCKVKLKEENLLEVRGYIGFSLLGRTQKWTRVTEGF